MCGIDRVQSSQGVQETQSSSGIGQKISAIFKKRETPQVGLEISGPTDVKRISSQEMLDDLRKINNLTPPSGGAAKFWHNTKNFFRDVGTWFTRAAHDKNQYTVEKWSNSNKIIDKINDKYQKGHSDMDVSEISKEIKLGKTSLKFQSVSTLNKAKAPKLSGKISKITLRKKPKLNDLVNSFQKNKLAPGGIPRKILHAMSTKKGSLELLKHTVKEFSNENVEFLFDVRNLAYKMANLEAGKNDMNPQELQKAQDEILDSFEQIKNDYLIKEKSPKEINLAYETFEMVKGAFQNLSIDNTEDTLEFLGRCIKDLKQPLAGISSRFEYDIQTHTPETPSPGNVDIKLFSKSNGLPENQQKILKAFNPTDKSCFNPTLAQYLSNTEDTQKVLDFARKSEIVEFDFIVNVTNLLTSKNGNVTFNDLKPIFEKYLIDQYSESSVNIGGLQVWEANYQAYQEQNVDKMLDQIYESINGQNGIQVWGNIREKLNPIM